MPTLIIANKARADKHLDELVRTTAYGVVTRRERITRALETGAAQLELGNVCDFARIRAIERQIKQMMGNGWGVPTGNDRHPLTIKYNNLKAELKAGPTKAEYRLDFGKYFVELTKTEYDFALTVKY